MRHVANLVDVDGSEAFLDRGHTRTRRCLEPEEIGRHLLHAGRRKKDGRVVGRNQRRAGNTQVPTLGKEFAEYSANIVTFHGQIDPHLNRRAEW